MKILFTLLLTTLVASAQVYSVNQQLPSTSPWYTNVVPTPVDTSSIQGGVMATNGCPANTTNTAVFSTLLNLQNWDTIAIHATWTTPNAGVYGSNQVFLYPALDGVHADTNHPVWSSGFQTQAASNILDTNISVGSVGYVQAGFATQGTNACTNVGIQAFVKKKIQAVSGP